VTILLLLQEAESFFSARPPLLRPAHRTVAHRRPATTMLAGGDLLIVGAGTLGMRLIEEYKEQYPSARIVACTNTTKRHDDLAALGAEPVLSLPVRAFPNVVFLATPNAKDYVELCKQSLKAWEGPAEGGSFIMSSSIGVFAKGLPEATRVTEHAATNASSSNFSRTLVAAEDEVLGKGGTVMRIAGMYNLRKGRNSFFLRGGDIKRRADAFIGLVGYADVVQAALLITKAAPEKVSGEVFIICDGQEQTVESVFQNGHAALRYLGEHPDEVNFSGVEASKGLLYDNSKLKLALAWEPSIDSFKQYCNLIQEGSLNP